MKISDVYIVCPSPDRIPLKRIAEVERAIGFPFPRGYREYLSRLGYGYLQNWLMVDLPDVNVIEKKRRHASILFSRATFHFTGPELTSEDMATSVTLGFTQDGQDVLACPRLPGWAFLVSWGGEIHGIKTGFERVDLLLPTGLEQSFGFVFFEPSHVLFEHRRLRCSARVGPAELEAMFRERATSTPAHAAWVNTQRASELWLFIKAWKARLTIRGGEQTLIDVRIHKEQLPHLQARLQVAEQRYGVQFKRARE